MIQAVGALTLSHTFTPSFISFYVCDYNVQSDDRIYNLSKLTAHSPLLICVCDYSFFPITFLAKNCLQEFQKCLHDNVHPPVKDLFDFLRTLR